MANLTAWSSGGRHFERVRGNGRHFGCGFGAVAIWGQIPITPHIGRSFIVPCRYGYLSTLVGLTCQPLTGGGRKLSVSGINRPEF